MIYVFLADGFEETEATAPIDLLRRARKNVKTVGVTGKTVVSSHGIPYVSDIPADDISLDGELEMIVLPGGLQGTKNLEENDTVGKAIDFCVKNDRFVSAICAAPTILGKRGLLDGKKATCYGGMENDLGGAVYLEVPAVRDGIFITGRGAGASVDFALLLVEALTSKEEADSLAKKIMFHC